MTLSANMKYLIVCITLLTFARSGPLDGNARRGDNSLIMSVSLVWLRRLPKDEIAARVAAFRAKISESGAGDKDVPRDEFGRVA